MCRRFQTRGPPSSAPTGTPNTSPSTNGDRGIRPDHNLMRSDTSHSWPCTHCVLLPLASWRVYKAQNGIKKQQTDTCHKNSAIHCRQHRFLQKWPNPCQEVAAPHSPHSHIKKKEEWVKRSRMKQRKTSQMDQSRLWREESTTYYQMEAPRTPSFRTTSPKMDPGIQYCLCKCKIASDEASKYWISTKTE